MAQARLRTAALVAIQGAALLGSGCATGQGYSISQTAPAFSDQASSDEGADEDGGRRRWRRFVIRRGDDGALIQTADTAGFGGGSGLGRAADSAAPVGGLRYLIGNLTPRLGQLGGLTTPVAGMTSALVSTTNGVVGALPGGAMAQTLLNGGQSTTSLAIASLTTRGAGLGGATSGSTSNGATVGLGGTSVSAGVSTGAAVPGGDLAGVGVGVSAGGLPTGNLPTTGVLGGVASTNLPVVGTSLGGVTGGGLSAGIGIGRGSGNLPSVTTTITNSGSGILGR